jgi:hypothetical protein
LEILEFLLLASENSEKKNLKKYLKNLEIDLAKSFFFFKKRNFSWKFARGKWI